MEVETVTYRDVRILRCASQIFKPADAVDLVTACIEHRSRLLLLEPQAFADSFFDLRTGIAGEVVQKLQSYGTRTAAVFPADREYPERFKEFLVEAKRGWAFRAFTSRSDALDWLCAG
ncbi:MAG TPA: DUF4180 domain-containing protein [Thermoanaerobaculia bacterium]|nr:DUF4180 domain-containing protein [Thermoanaerobaculia bacterium]